MDYYESIRKQFEYYKLLGERTFEQLADEHLFIQPAPESNSIAVIVKHLSGNMRSRWTDFLSTDGEKEWRKRDEEFLPDLQTRAEVMHAWQIGWHCLFSAFNELKESDRDAIVYIRNLGHTVTEAINRQLAHYAYHVGQIVYIGKMLAAENWQSLTIPKGKSETYNAQKFARAKRRSHFTDDFIKNQS